METKLLRGTIEDERWLEGAGDCLKQAVTFRLSRAGADAMRAAAGSADAGQLPRVGEPVRFVRCFWRMGARSPEAAARGMGGGSVTGGVQAGLAQQELVRAVRLILQRPAMVVLR